MPRDEKKVSYHKLNIQELMDHVKSDSKKSHSQPDLVKLNVYKINIDELLRDGVQTEDHKIIIKTINESIGNIGTDEHKRNILQTILPILSEIPDDNLGKSNIFNQLIRRSYDDEAIKSIFRENGQEKINDARKGWLNWTSDFYRDQDLKKKVGATHLTDAPKSRAIEVAFFVASIPASLLEGFARGMGATIFSSIYLGSNGRIKNTDYRHFAPGGNKLSPRTWSWNLNNTHNWARMVRDQLSSDGGSDLEQDSNILSWALKGIGYAAGSIAGFPFGVIGGGVAALNFGYNYLTGWYTSSRETNFQDRAELTLDTENIFITEKDKKIEFQQPLKDKIFNKQQEKESLITKRENKSYIGVGLKITSKNNTINAKNGYIEVEDVFCGSPEIKKGDKISKIKVDGKEIDFTNGTFTNSNGTREQLDLENVSKKLTELLLKTPDDKSATFTIVDNNGEQINEVILDKQVFIKNQSERILYYQNHDFLPLNEANDSDIISAYNQLIENEASRAKSKAGSDTDIIETMRKKAEEATAASASVAPTRQESGAGSSSAPAEEAARAAAASASVAPTRQGPPPSSTVSAARSPSSSVAEEVAAASASVAPTRQGPPPLSTVSAARSPSSVAEEVAEEEAARAAAKQESGAEESNFALGEEEGSPLRIPPPTIARTHTAEEVIRLNDRDPTFHQ